MNHRQRCVKILATLGPSTETEEQIEALFIEGADAFRINMSHASIEKMNELMKRIRNVEKKCQRPISVLVDLQGPKYRIDRFENSQVTLEIGSIFSLVKEKISGNKDKVHLPHPEVFPAIKQGHALLLDDGKIALEVIDVSPNEIRCKVKVGGSLKDRKGISFPDTELPVGALTDIDRTNLSAAIEAGADWIALSFVQRADDVAEARKLARGKAGILSKIEKPLAIQEIDAILELSDALMVARGDLGVEMPLEKVPGVQKRLCRLARMAGKPVVVATQMLESMIESPVPTRAEVSDVATAVYEGADAVMLSAESAAGKYPVETVRTMNSIAITTEQDSIHRVIMESQHAQPEQTGADAIAQAARMVADTLELGAIVCYTSSGSTALRISRERPTTPILTLTPLTEIARRLSLVWGLHTVITDDAVNEDDMIQKASKAVNEAGFVGIGQRYLVTAGVPFGTPGTTNLLRIAYVNR